MTEHVRLDDVVSFLNERLEVSKFDEEESNGLIVRASDVVTSIAAAVSGVSTRRTENGALGAYA